MPRNKTSIGDVREACVREAFAIVGESGLDSLSLRDVARRLGVSHQAPYKHFRSRDHLLAVLVGRAFDEFAVHLDARDRSDDPWIDFFHMGQAYLAFARTRPLYYRLMFGATLPDPAQHPDMVRSAQHALSMLRGGVIGLPGRVAGVAADLDALFAWSAVHGLATLLEAPACRTAGLAASVLEDAGVHTLMRIGRALGQGGGV